MFDHKHPYEVFIPEGTRKIIIGTLPPPRFSTRQLREKDVDFCYGSCDGMLWPVLDAIYNIGLVYDNSQYAVDQRKDFLLRQRLGICDIVDSCQREKVDASDLGMSNINLRDILAQIRIHESLSTLLFMGGNSKNGPEYLFRRQLKNAGLKLLCDKKEIPRVHSFFYADKKLTTVSLTSPSNAANRAIGATQLYKKRKLENPSYTTFDFRVEQYSKVFLS